MSYFLFGTFDAVCDKKIIESVKAYGKEKDIYIWFDEEITFYRDIHSMLLEQKSNGNIRFAITSKNQPRNSDDILFPFDKFTSEILFADTSRSFYRKCCRDNIDTLFTCIDIIVDLFHAKHMQMFVVEGYDDQFLNKVCSIDEVKEDLLHQIGDKVLIDSCIYNIQ